MDDRQVSEVGMVTAMSSGNTQTPCDDASDDASIYTCSKCEFQGNWEYGDGDTFHFYVQNPDRDIDDELFCVDRERDFICTNCEEEINGQRLTETDEESNPSI